MHSLDLIDMGAIPDDRVMSDLEGDVKAIVPTHGHLDHIGAISKLAHRYDAPIVATPFTIELVKQQIKCEEKFNVRNDLVKMEAGEMMSIGDRKRTGVRPRHTLHHRRDQSGSPHAGGSHRLRSRQADGPLAGPRRPHRHEALPRDRP